MSVTTFNHSLVALHTRRDVVSGQTEGNSVRVAEDVHRVEGFSHKMVQVHHQR